MIANIIITYSKSSQPNNFLLDLAVPMKTQCWQLRLQLEQLELATADSLFCARLRSVSFFSLLDDEKFVSRVSSTNFPSELSHNT